MQSDKALNSGLHFWYLSTLSTGLSTFSVESVYLPVVAALMESLLEYKTNIIRRVSVSTKQASASKSAPTLFF
jgi:hypothetical protein